MLLICLVLLTGIGFRSSGYELFAPITIVPLMFVVAVVLALIGWGSWNQIELQSDGFTIISIGCLAFLIGGILVERFVFNRKLSSTSRESSPVKSTTQSFSNPQLSLYYILGYIALFLILCLAIYVRIKDTYRLGAQMGFHYSGYSDLVSQVRKQTTAINGSNNVKIGQGFSFLEKQLEKFAMAIGYLCSYLLAKALRIWIKDRKNKKNCLLAIFPSILLITNTIFNLVSGGRTQIFYNAAAVFFSLFILGLRNHQNPLKLSRNFIIFLVPAAVIFTALFYTMSGIIGRKTSSGILDYISFYLGAGIPSLQHLLASGAPSLGWGGYTFFGLQTLLYKIGFINHLSSYSIQWVPLAGKGSNIFTTFARYYLDFGYFGVIFLSLLLGALLTWMYRYCLNCKYEFVIPVFMMFAVSLVDLPREDYLYSRFLSSAPILQLILLAFLSFLMTADYKKLAKRIVRPLIQSTSTKNQESRIE
jgi:oligosaccharide repeat unit polymerase